MLMLALVFFFLFRQLRTTVLFYPPCRSLYLTNFAWPHCTHSGPCRALSGLAGALSPPKRASLVSPPACAMTGNYGTPPRTRPASSPPTPAEQPGLLTRQERHLLGKPRHHSAHPRGRAAVAQPHARVDCDRVELLFERLAESSRCPRRGRVRHLHEERGVWVGAREAGEGRGERKGGAARSEGLGRGTPPRRIGRRGPRLRAARRPTPPPRLPVMGSLLWAHKSVMGFNLLWPGLYCVDRPNRL